MDEASTGLQPGGKDNPLGVKTREALEREGHIPGNGIGIIISRWAENPGIVPGEIEPLGEGGEPTSGAEVARLKNVIFQEAFGGKMPNQTGYSRKLFTEDGNTNRKVIAIFFRAPTDPNPQGAEDFEYAYMYGIEETNPYGMVITAQGLAFTPNLRERIGVYNPPSKFIPVKILGVNKVENLIRAGKSSL